MKGSNPPCPCGSGLKYAACCRPFHRGEEPPDPVALVRSRFSAYALGEADHLWRTLHPDHPDRQQPREAWIADLRQGRAALRFVRLRILDHAIAADGQTAQVLFHAEIFERGTERSFLEKSSFARTAEGWRYRDGELAAISANAPGLADFTLATPFPAPG